MRKCDRDILLTAIILALIYCAMGCAAAKVPASLNVAGNAAQETETRADVIADQAKTITGNEPQKRTIIEQAGKIKTASLAAKNAINAAVKELASVARKLEDVLADPWHKAAMVVKAIWRIYVTLLVLLLIMRIAALFVTGPVGSIMAHVSTWGLGILTLGISATTSAADNYWFRKRAAK